MRCPVCHYDELLTIGARSEVRESWEVLCPDCGYHAVDQHSKSAAIYAFRHKMGTFSAEVSE